MSRIFVLGLERDLRAGAWVSRSVGVPDLRVRTFAWESRIFAPDLRAGCPGSSRRIFALGVPDLRAGSSRADLRVGVPDLRAGCPGSSRIFAHEAFSKARPHLRRLVLHQVKAAGVEHVLGLHSASRSPSMLRPRPSLMKSGENFARLPRTSPMRRWAGRMSSP